jgi:hypothetical protein
MLTRLLNWLRKPRVIESYPLVDADRRQEEETKRKLKKKLNGQLRKD